MEVIVVNVLNVMKTIIYALKIMGVVLNAKQDKY